MSTAAFDAVARAGVYAAIHRRRDVRHFRSGGTVAPELLERLLQAAHAAPSVGLSQPWRILRVRRPALREAIRCLVMQERQRTGEALGPRREEFLALKVEGIRECAELLVVGVEEGGAREVFGRRTLPQMSLASASCAIQNLWLAARAEGLGMGWVSMFDPDALAPLVGFPAAIRPVALLCLGPTDEFAPRPLLEDAGWRTRRPLAELYREDVWPQDPLR